MVDWEETRANAAIAVLEAILENGTTGEILEIMPSIPVKQSVRVANCLIEELKRNKNNDDLIKEIKEDIKKFFNVKKLKNLEN